MPGENVKTTDGHGNTSCGTRTLTRIFFTDKKCPFTGLVSIRGRILTGTVVSTKMHRTLVIRREYLHFIPKYSRYERRHKNLSAHVSPAFRVEDGDQVTVGQCRPLSKTVCTILYTHLETIEGSDYQKTDTPVIGPLQRPPRASPNRQGCQVLQQVLDDGRSVYVFLIENENGGSIGRRDRDYETWSLGAPMSGCIVVGVRAKAMSLRGRSCGIFL
jgi:ribosomal protein uS17